MRRGNSADNRRQGQGEHGSQASPANQPEELPLPPNPNEVIGTMAAMIRKKTRAHEAHLKQLEELYTRAQQGPRETERGNSYIFDKFRKLNPTEFQEESDPAIAEDWINSLEVIFEFMAIEHAEKIWCATFMLKREARKWWETAKQGKDLRTMTWSQFRDLFFEKYFSADVRAHRAYKFYSLRQGDKSVAEYVRRFEQLVGYVPHIAK